MGAGVSKILSQAEVNHPMYERGLRRLQHRIDEFNEEVAKLVQYWFLFLIPAYAHYLRANLSKFHPLCAAEDIRVETSRSVKIFPHASHERLDMST